jgi:hypothetical protein
MKREPKQPGQKRLVLRRETLKVLDDDALHQVRGGAGARSGSKFVQMQMNQN